MRILITGSRDWEDEDLIREALSEFVGVKNTLVSGHCPTGADKMCEDFAAREEWDIELHPADWDKYKKRAGFVRNEEMVNLGADYCVAFIKNGSKGATMTSTMAIRAGIETRIILP